MKIDFKKQAQFIPATGTWLYWIDWDQLGELAGMLDYVNRDVEIRINGEDKTMQILDRVKLLK